MEKWTYKPNVESHGKVISWIVGPVAYAAGVDDGKGNPIPGIAIKAIAKDDENIARRIAALPALEAAMRDLLGGAQLSQAQNSLYHDTAYCACCGANAPKDDAGLLVGKLVHREGCIIGAAVAALAPVSQPL